jgi:hypothetical protein
MEMILWPRSLAMAMMRGEGYGLARIGSHFNRDHGTVKYAVDAVQARIKSDPRQAQDYADIKKSLAAIEPKVLVEPNLSTAERNSLVQEITREVLKVIQRRLSV